MCYVSQGIQQHSVNGTFCMITNCTITYISSFILKVHNKSISIHFVFCCNHTFLDKTQRFKILYRPGLYRLAHHYVYFLIIYEYRLWWLSSPPPNINDLVLFAIRSRKLDLTNKLNALI